jgi:hypothetical protein
MGKEFRPESSQGLELLGSWCHFALLADSLTGLNYQTIKEGGT